MERATAIKRELESFIKAHIPQATITSIDEIVLSYVVDVLEGMGEEESSFDVDQFTEMISAYVPEFAEVESSVVCEWIFELVEKQQKRSREGREDEDSGGGGGRGGGEGGGGGAVGHSVERDTPTGDASGTSVTSSLASGTESSQRPCTEEKTAVGGEGGGGGEGEGGGGEGTEQKAIQSSRNERTRAVEGGVSRLTETQVPLQSSDGGENDEVILLREMFPDVTEACLRAAHQSCGGDMEMTIQRLLAAAEEHSKGQEMQTSHTTPCSHKYREVKDDQQLKEILLARYAYVDAEEDKVMHRPFLPKSESKKMVRYRDNQVVSTKGERFSLQSRKDNEGEEMKKTYINLKPLKKYRFH